MNKPTTLLIEEFKNNISNVINESELPLFIIESIIKDLYIEVKGLSDQIAQQEKEEYLLNQEQTDESALSD